MVLLHYFGLMQGRKESQMHKGKKLSIIVFILSLLGFSQSMLAQDISPQTGTWAIDEEINGKPGRGFQIEVQNDILVLYFYGYEKTGESTYWLAAGKLASGSNELTADLGAYEGGMAFGDPIKDAVYLGSKGSVTIRFNTVASGEICLPDETCKAVRPFNFGYEESASELLGRWLVTVFNNGPNTQTFTVELNFTEVDTPPYPDTIDRVSGTATYLNDSDMAHKGDETRVECSRLIQPNPEPYFCRLVAGADATETYISMMRNALVGRYHNYGGPWDYGDAWVNVIGFRLASGSGRQVIPN